MQTLTLNKRLTLYKALTAFFAVIAAVALPQVFHAAGVISGTGAALGAALLPMQLPVLLAGMTGGPIVGVIAGVISPVVSFALSGMPTAALLPFMVLELGVYGLTAGLLSKTKLPSFAQLVLTQLAGRIVRAAAIVVSVLAVGGELSLQTVLGFVTAGLFGIMLQWAVLPLLAPKMRKLYE